MSDKSLQVGDVVYLPSHPARLMTVTYIGGEKNVKVMLFNETGELRFEVFNDSAPALVKKSDDPKDPNAPPTSDELERMVILGKLEVSERDLAASKRAEQFLNDRYAELDGQIVEAWKIARERAGVLRKDLNATVANLAAALCIKLDTIKREGNEQIARARAQAREELLKEVRAAIDAHPGVSAPSTEILQGVG